MLVTSALPLRVYLFDGGVVPFGAAPGSASPANPDPGGPADPGGAQPAANAGADLIVNLWRLDRSQARKPAKFQDSRNALGLMATFRKLNIVQSCRQERLCCSSPGL